MELTELARRLGGVAQTRNEKQTCTLFRRGDPTNYMFGVIEGEARLLRHTIDGVQIPLHRARPGEFFAEASLFAKVYHCDGEIAAGSRIMTFPKAAMLALMANDGEFAQAFCEHLAGQVQRLRSGIELRAIRSAPERVMAALSFRLPDSAIEMELQGTWKGFALDIGLTHEALYRALKTLETAGRLYRTGRTVRMAEGT